VTRAPLAWLPIALSVASVALIVGYVVACPVAGCVPRPDGDEGAIARIFQLSMLVQAALIGLFALRWVPASPRPAVTMLILQIVAAAVPVVLIVILEG
jgi:hypothetical protein